jgi:hypothetical protein
MKVKVAFVAVDKSTSGDISQLSDAFAALLINALAFI